MKAKISLKKVILSIATMAVLVSCNINVIPTVVTKDVSLGLLTVNGLQNEISKAQVVTLDLSSFISDDEFNALETVELKEFIVTLNADYKNTVTQSEDFKGLIIFFLITEGKPFTTNDTFSGIHASIAESSLDFSFKKEVPHKFFVNKKDYNIKEIIKDKKIKLGVIILKEGLGNFNDASFSFTLKAKTEVQIN